MDAILTDLGINFRVVAFQAVVFIVLFLIMRRLLFQRTHAFMQARESEIEETRRQVQAERDLVERLMAEYQAKIAVIEREANARLQEIVREAIAQRNEILKQAHEQSSAELEKARAGIAVAKKEALGALRAELSRLTHETVEKVLDQKVDAAAVGSLIEQALAEFDRRTP